MSGPWGVVYDEAMGTGRPRPERRTVTTAAEPNGWTHSQVKRLLPYWRELAAGWYPPDPNRPAGYRGRRSDEAPYATAAHCAADLWLAHARIAAFDPGLAAAIRACYWERRTVQYKADVMVAAVYHALSRPSV